MLIVVYTFVVKHKQQTMAKLKRTMSRPERCRSPPCVRQKLSRQLSWRRSTAASYHPYHTRLVIVMVVMVVVLILKAMARVRVTRSLGDFDFVLHPSG